MTIETGYAPLSSAGDGATTTFTLSWPFASLGDVDVQLIVVATGLLLSPPPSLNGGGTYDYAITGTADPDTGIFPAASVVFNTAPPSIYAVWRGRATSDVQDKSLPTNGRLPAKAIEGALDIRTLLSEETIQAFGQTVRAAATDAALAPLAPVAARASKLAGYDAAGQPALSNSTVGEMDAAVAAFQSGALATATNVPYAPTLAAAKAMIGAGTLDNGHPMAVLGRAAAGDGFIQRDWLYDATDTTTAGDDMGVFVDGQSRRWKGVLKKKINVWEWAMPGSASGQDAAILAAIGAADLEGRELDFGPSSYVYTLTTGNGLKYAFANKPVWRGDGAAVLANPATGSILHVTNLNVGALGADIRGVAFVPNLKAWYGLYLRNQAASMADNLIGDVVIEGCSVNQAYAPINTGSPSGNAVAVGIYLYGGFRSVEIKGCKITDTRFSAAAAALMQPGSAEGIEIGVFSTTAWTKYLTVRDCDIKDTWCEDPTFLDDQDNIFVQLPAPGTADAQDVSCYIVGGTNINGRGRGIKLQCQNSVVHGVYFGMDSGSTARSSGTGLMRIDDQFGGATVSDCRAIYNGCGDGQFFNVTHRNQQHNSSRLSNTTILANGTAPIGYAMLVGDAAPGSLIRRQVVMDGVGAQASLTGLARYYTYNTTSALPDASLVIQNSSVHSLAAAAIVGFAAGGSGTTYFNSAIGNVVHAGTAVPKYSDASSGGSCSTTPSTFGANLGLT